MNSTSTTCTSSAPGGSSSTPSAYPSLPPFPCYRHGVRRSRGAHSFIPTHREARVEFGDVFASRLKTTDDGKTILWPQPYDTPEDPQNWSARRKALQLFIVTLAAIVPDFDSGIGMCAFRWGGGRGPGT